MMRFELPAPISVNDMYGTARNGTRYLTAQAKAWRELAGYNVNQQCAANKFESIPEKTPYLMLVIVHWVPGRTRQQQPDTGNCEKLLTDTLVKHGLVPDDRWCDGVFIVRGKAKPGGGMTVVVKAANRAPGVDLGPVFSIMHTEATRGH